VSKAAGKKERLMAASIYLKITALFAVLTALLMVVGFAVGVVLQVDPLFFMGIALVLAAILNFVMYYYSDSIVVRMSRARIISEGENPVLFAAVRNVAQKANIPMPKVGVVNSPAPNAFATGRGPDKAVVCATSSILQTLTPPELEAVIGHEIGHVVHRDVLMSSVAATMAGAISYIGNIALYSMWFGGGSNNRNNNASILALVAIILVPIGATFVRLGISRDDEYNADEYGARLTRNPAGLISALTKIDSQAKTRGFGRSRGGGVNNPNSGNSAPSPATASLWIVNPFRGSSLTELFSTHPSMAHRIERLKKVARDINVYVP